MMNLQQETDECLEHALIVARTSNAIPENNVRNIFVTSLLVAGKHTLLMETLSKMSVEDRVSCCHKLIYFIEGALNRYVNKSRPFHIRSIRSVFLDTSEGIDLIL